MKLFTVGPVEMYDSTLEVRSKQLPYFRTDFFSKLMLENEEMLKKALYTDKSSKAIFLTGSGTSAMDAVVGQCLSNEKALVIDGGSFGHRFVELCEFYGVEYESIHLDTNETLTVNHLQEYQNHDFTCMLVNMHETSTGQLYDIKMLSEFCIKKEMALIVDAISAFLCDEIKMDEMHIDCLITSSQKALSLAPGLSMIVVNDDFYQKFIKNKKAKSYYLDLNAHLKNMERGQTPFTPAVGVCYEVHDMLEKVLNKGVEQVIADKKCLANYFRENIKKLGIEVVDCPLSNALTPLYFKDGGAKALYENLKDKYDIYLTPCGGINADKIVRVGHMGNLCIDDYDDLINKIREVL